MSVRVFVLFSWTCESCSHINQGQHDPRGEIVSCTACHTSDDAVDAYPLADNGLDEADEEPAPVALDRCARTWPHDRHPWEGVAPGRAEYHGRTFICPGIPTPGAPA